MAKLPKKPARLVLSAQQYQQMQQATMQTFYSRVANALFNIPELVSPYATPTDNALLKIIAQATTKAKTLHITEEFYVYHFVGYALEFGLDTLENDALSLHQSWFTSPHVPSFHKIVKIQQLLTSQFFKAVEHE